MQVTEILTDHTLMALELRGAPEYPIRFYLDIMDQFDRAGIHWHWHPELEFNVITRGTMEYYVENEHHTLTAGQGIFKNANILHMAHPGRGDVLGHHGRRLPGAASERHLPKIRGPLPGQPGAPQPVPLPSGPLAAANAGPAPPVLRPEPDGDGGL